MKKAHWIGVGIAAVVAAAVLCYVFIPAGDGKPAATQQTPVKGKKRSHAALLRQKGAEKSAVKPISERSQTPREKGAKGKPKLGGRLAGSIGGGADDVFRDPDGKAYPEKDQALMRQAREAIDNDDLESARALAAEAAASTNDELREMAVEALSWFGKDAMVELMQFMADANEDVAEEAKSGWMAGLQEIEDEGEKAGVIEATMKCIHDDEMLEDIANELIGTDDLAAIQVLVDVIEDGGNPAAVKAAKETYNTITGEDWSNVDKAEAWLQENYEPDEDDDNDGE